MKIVLENANYAVVKFDEIHFIAEITTKANGNRVWSIHERAKVDGLESALSLCNEMQSDYERLELISIIRKKLENSCKE